MENLDIDQNEFSATYSPEDNKLRIYADHRLDDDVYQEFKKQGFRWAPKQELFVAPMWTVEREDFCLLMAGDITAEESTMVERAEAKVDRLENIVERKGIESNSFALAADRISQRFAGGQPILVGHHSERKARNDQAKMHSAMDKSIKASKAIDYWNYKINGVERHANRKANAGVRGRRIKKLLADLRDRQRVINHAHVCLKLWTKINQEEDTERFFKQAGGYLGARIRTGDAAPWGLSDDVREEKITLREAAQKAQENAENILTSPYWYRWVAHILNRLGYERSELGAVEKFDGDLTPGIVQTFARVQGAHGPKALLSGKGFKIDSFVELPAHLADSSTLDLTTLEWLDLMQSVGYEVPAAKAKQPPILNFKADTLTKGQGQYKWQTEETYSQVSMTKKEYSNSWEKWTCLSACGQFRFRVSYSGKGRFAVFLTDSKIHPSPLETVAHG